ncbi:MAG: tyrosine-type recombinase/integrase [Nanoarchaeota archaeon]|nr:tyrosine-type recombinase/integrase [Nanoarchaeota archaeon]MBU1974302.1 tyrosine-type recombinase/integrase [Nanoarchaeota archaeon]
MSKKEVVDEGKENQKPTIIRKGHSRSQFHLTEEQIKLLIKHAEKLRDKLIIKLFAYCGLRRFELAKIKIEEINFETRKIRILGKKNIDRLATIFSDQLVEDLKLYHQYVLNNRPKGYLFPAVSSLNNNGHITPTQINRIVAKAGQRAQLNNPVPELKNINPHILRHSCARILKDKGLSLEVVQKVLGHLSYKTTMDLYGTKSITEMDEELKEKIGDLFG